MRIFLPAAVAAVVLVLSGPASAQSAPPERPGRPDVSRVAAGTYKVDTDHTQVAFTVNHFGFTDYHGLIGGSTGSLTIDPSQPAAAKVEIEIPLGAAITTSKALDAHLQKADFFETARFPKATFRSTRIEVDGERARIVGDLTLRGVTQPVVLDARFTGAGVNPMNKAATIGFEASTSIKRSAFGMTFAVPMVSDQVDLTIAAAFEKAN
ncbi:YceI family protein [Rhodoplanes sp. TEM]|uniref:YceI family protein n=1 Tax=Rhodoplanes tepidamans TaxID=200616 RepID=A0ABT5J380_RHOTP|nr:MULTISPECIES: YceI family protein [Rhodoplanes]MDC7784125.1 YceI family protein [Rhodoplanes tepidamans]MDC7983220.1 YceI family protein [Rhodoplanes sp. TEM]MDQ0356778.1 polyisoprenoid-binding protein YceI [Rhodoplanes tepidamans]